MSKSLRDSILFVVGILIIIGEVVNALIRDKSVQSAILILGLTLCGVGVTQSLMRKNGKAT